MEQEAAKTRVSAKPNTSVSINTPYSLFESKDSEECFDMSVGNKHYPDATLEGPKSGALAFHSGKDIVDFPSLELPRHVLDRYMPFAALLRGQPYHNLILKSYRANMAELWTETGMLSISWNELPDLVQKRYGPLKDKIDKRDNAKNIIAQAQIALPQDLSFGKLFDANATHMCLVGTSELLMSGNVSFKMKQDVPYSISAIDKENRISISTDRGIFRFPDTAAQHFVVQPGGMFIPMSINLSEIEAEGKMEVTEPAQVESANSSGYHGLATFQGEQTTGRYYVATYEAKLVSQHDIPNLYIAFEWRVDTGIVATNIMLVGSVAAGEVYPINTGVKVGPEDKRGTYSLHFYSGSSEIMPQAF